MNNMGPLLTSQLGEQSMFLSLFERIDRIRVFLFLWVLAEICNILDVDEVDQGCYSECQILNGYSILVGIPFYEMNFWR